MRGTLRVVHDESTPPTLFTDTISAVNTVLIAFLQKVDPEIRQMNGKPWPCDSIIEVAMAGLPANDSREGRLLTQTVMQTLWEILPGVAVELHNGHIRVLPDKCHPDAPSARDLYR